MNSDGLLAYSGETPEEVARICAAISQIAESVDARATLDRATPERDLQALVLEAARYFGWLAYHTHDSRRSQSGYPDLTLLKPPRCIFAELKKVGKYPTPAQRTWLAALAQCPGVEVYVWRITDWETIVATLARE